MSTIIKKKIQFDKAGIYLMALLVVAILGFWPSYFSKFVDGTANFTQYIHVHAVIMLFWVLALIAQPILIRKGQLSLHRLIGKISYVLFPLVIIAAALLAHHRTEFSRDVARGLFITFKDIVVLLVAYGIAIAYRKDTAIHARAMIATAIPFLEPALVRFLGWILPKDFSVNPYLLTVLIMDLILIGLIIRERKEKRGRWVFPLILGLYFIIQFIIFNRVEIPGWQSLAEWYASLPLT